MYFGNSSYQNQGQDSYYSNRDYTGEGHLPQTQVDRHDQVNQVYRSNNNNSLNKRNSFGKFLNVRQKIHEVIDLCKDENTQAKGQLGSVVTAEKDILGLLLQNPQLLNRNLSVKNIAPQIPHVPQQRPSLRQTELNTPVQQPRTVIPQSHYYIPNFSQLTNNIGDNYAANISQSNIRRPESNYIPQHVTQPAQDRLRQDFNHLKQSKQVLNNDNAIGLINQIEKRAFQQIQKLRAEKIELMQRLNQQIRNVNAEKKKNLQLENALQSIHAGGAGNYQGHIQRLESELQRITELNNHLRLQLNQKGSGVPGIEELLRQGEIIRQETLKLLKLKESENKGNQRIQQLQRRLAQQASEKNSLLIQLQSYRSRNEAVQSKQDRPKSKAPQTGKRTGQYEDMLADLKRMTGF